jgi:hypothetical protein
MQAIVAQIVDKMEPESVSRKYLREVFPQILFKPGNPARTDRLVVKNKI